MAEAKRLAAAGIASILGVREGAVGVAGREFRAEVPPSDLPVAAKRLARGLGARLAGVVATDDRAVDGSFGVRYVFALDRWAFYAVIAARLPADDPRFPSVTPETPAAQAPEREAWEMFGIVPTGHPDLRNLLLHEDWPRSAHPLRKDFPAGGRPPRVPGEEFPFQRVAGEGVFEIPVGPVHAGIIEPGHFRFSVAGEPVLNLEIRLGYVHKGLEKLGEGKDPAAGAELAERISGDAPVAHAWAFCEALERIAGAEIPPRAEAIRAVLAELERLHNHLADVAGIATDVGFPFGAAQMLLLRERILQRNAALTGHRLLRGVVRPGGAARDLSAEAARDLRSFTGALSEEFSAVERLYKDTDSLMDRAEGAGVLARRVAEDLGGVGPAARASGVDIDLRRDIPYGPYGRLRFAVCVRSEGDVAARMLVKMDEARESFAILRQLLGAMPEGPHRTDIRAFPAGAALGGVESSRGETLHWVRTDRRGTLDRWKIKSPSSSNWPLVPWAVRGNIVPDFPLINKSFNLSYAGHDR